MITIDAETVAMFGRLVSGMLIAPAGLVAIGAVIWWSHDRETGMIDPWRLLGAMIWLTIVFLFVVAVWVSN